MNGQLNGFHDAFIEEGTFLFTSESVGEGHSGEAPGPGGERAGRGEAGRGEGAWPGRTRRRRLPHGWPSLAGR